VTLEETFDHDSDVYLCDTKASGVTTYDFALYVVELVEMRIVRVLSTDPAANVVGIGEPGNNP